MTSSTNPDELAKYIQYRLGAMGEENAHYRFAELCFRVEKATVASHLLPPTGPVSAGGDQGRDFESFRIEGTGGNMVRIISRVRAQKYPKINPLLSPAFLHGNQVTVSDTSPSPPPSPDRQDPN